jgi:inhibitor of KinA sporulation pathway (predicted exonuclease)
MRYVIIDLEATCWEEGILTDRMEIIEIGAVMLQSAAGPAIGEFERFVRPIIAPILSDFCKQLTTITQEQIDAAEDFKTVFPEFVRWIGAEDFIFCSWGQYDLNQLRLDCERHQMEFPPSLENHINLKNEFARVFKVRRCGMARALRHAKIPLEGTHHRGIDDARNIARLAMLVLPKLEEERLERELKDLRAGRSL